MCELRQKLVKWARYGPPADLYCLGEVHFHLAIQQLDTGEEPKNVMRRLRAWQRGAESEVECGYEEVRS